jgi:hypothetical protein
LVGLPQGDNRVTTARGAAFAAAVRVIDRVHDNAANMRANGPFQRWCDRLCPSFCVHVVGVGYRAPTVAMHSAHDAQFAGCQFHLCVALITTNQLGEGSGGAAHLCAFAGLSSRYCG